MHECEGGGDSYGTGVKKLFVYFECRRVCCNLKMHFFLSGHILFICYYGNKDMDCRV